MSELLSHENAGVRRRALEMFNERVLIQRDLLSRSDILLFVELVSDLNTVLELYIEKIREKSNKKKKKSKKRKKKMTKEEEIELESAHTALLGLTILADSLALKHSEAFESVSKLIVEIIDTKADLFEMKMRCSAVLCFATLTRCLGPKMLPHLSRVVPRVRSLLLKYALTRGHLHDAPVTSLSSFSHL